MNISKELNLGLHWKFASLVVLLQNKQFKFAKNLWTYWACIEYIDFNQNWFVYSVTKELKTCVYLYQDKFTKEVSKLYKTNPTDPQQNLRHCVSYFYQLLLNC